MIHFHICFLSFEIYHCIYSKRQLYWADALEDRIEVSDFDGRERRPIVEHTAHPFSIALFESDLYWSNWYNKSIWKVPRRKSPEKPREIRSGLGGALDIRAVSQSRQPHQWSPCMENNGDCSHLCLYKYSSYVCECPDKDDSRSCETGEIYSFILRQFQCVLLKIDLIFLFSGEFQVTYRPASPIDYEIPDTHDDDYSGSHSGDNSSIARIVIIATAILGVLLIIVLCAILCMFHILFGQKNNL